MVVHERIRINRLVSQVLEDAGEPLTMGQIMVRGEIVKTLAGDVSSALHKLRAAGKVATSRGPSTSPNGPRYVNRYRWVRRAPQRTEPASVQVVRPGGVFAGLGVVRV